MSKQKFGVNEIDCRFSRHRTSIGSCNAGAVFLFIDFTEVLFYDTLLNVRKFSMIEISTSTIAFRLFVAFLLSGIVGFEREWYRKPAGLRTLVIVGLASALFTIVSFRLRDLFPSALVDPSHIAAQVVTGIGFLGAGSIIRARGEIVGLTTAASIFMVAAIGMASGFGLYTEAIVATILVFATFYGLSYIVLFIRNHSPAFTPHESEHEQNHEEEHEVNPVSLQH